MAVVADPVKIKFPRPAGLSNQGWKILQNGALDLARSLTPVDTGNLRAQFAWSEDPLSSRTIKLENNTPYADFVDKGTRAGDKYPDPKGKRYGMAPRNFSGKIYDQLAALAGHLMQQFPAATGGTNQGTVQSQQAIGAEAAKEAEFSLDDRNRGNTFSHLARGNQLGDFGSQVSVNAPGVQKVIGDLTGKARQDAYLKFLAGAHAVPRR